MVRGRKQVRRGNAHNHLGRNKAWFEEDLKEIESEKTDTTQKLATIQRMYHTYTFLQSPNKLLA